MTARPKNPKTGTSDSSAPDLTDLVKGLNIIGRSLGALALRFAPSRPKSITDQSHFLRALGFDRNEIAGIIGTTPGTVSVRLAEGRTPRRRRKKTHGKN